MGGRVLQMGLGGRKNQKEFLKQPGGIRQAYPAEKVLEKIRDMVRLIRRSVVQH